MAKDVAQIGESAPTVMNAANEIAVLGFLKKDIKFKDIYKIIYETINAHKNIKISSVEDVFEIDNESRLKAAQILKKYS